MSETGHDVGVNGDAQQTSRMELVRAGLTPIQTQRLEALRLLAPGVALEFGNLMTIVLGSMEQLRRQPLNGPGREQLQHAESGVRQVARLISQALSLTRHEEGRGHPVELNEAVRGVDKMLTHIAGENAKVILELSRQPLFAQLETDQFELALFDLVRSAADAISGNGLIIIRTSAHWVDRLGDQPTVELSVTVTGAASIVASPELEGSAPVWRFASHCGAEIVTEASPGSGMTVRLIFPAASSSQ